LLGTRWRERFARFGGRRWVWRLGGGVPCEEGELWRRVVGVLTSTAAVKIDDDMEESRWLHGGSLTEAATGEAGPLKRWRSTASAPHSSEPEQLPLSENAPVRYVSPACYDLHLDLHVVAAVVGTVVAAVGWLAMTLFMALHYLLAVLHG
jgi:hypothetical protein